MFVNGMTQPSTAPLVTKPTGNPFAMTQPDRFIANHATVEPYYAVDPSRRTPLPEILFAEPGLHVNHMTDEPAIAATQRTWENPATMVQPNPFVSTESLAIVSARAGSDFYAGIAPIPAEPDRFANNISMSEPLAIVPVGLPPTTKTAEPDRFVNHTTNPSTIVPQRSGSPVMNEPDRFINNHSTEPSTPATRLADFPRNFATRRGSSSGTDLFKTEAI
jgi:hypothetical protein